MWSSMAVEASVKRSTRVEEHQVSVVSEHKEETGFKCDLCEFKSSRENGLIIHMGRKHKDIEQLDGLDASISEDFEDTQYSNTEKYWKTGCLGTSFQYFLDANEIIETSSLDDIEKENERAAIIAARKDAFGDQYQYYPPWR